MLLPEYFSLSLSQRQINIFLTLFLGNSNLFSASNCTAEMLIHSLYICTVVFQGGTILGDPDRVEELGESQVPYQLFLEYIFGLGEATYKYVYWCVMAA